MLPQNPNEQILLELFVIKKDGYETQLDGYKTLPDGCETQSDGCETLPDGRETHPYYNRYLIILQHISYYMNILSFYMDASLGVSLLIDLTCKKVKGGGHSLEGN